MKLKDGKTYITRSGLKRIVRKVPARKSVLFGGVVCFESASICGDGINESYDAYGHTWMRDTPKTSHKWDLVKEAK
jgi:hypothetical protein